MTLKTDTEILEAMIDRHGLVYVLTALELVCGEKAVHLAVNWQDAKTAKMWDREAVRLYKVAHEVEV